MPKRRKLHRGGFLFDAQGNRRIYTEADKEPDPDYTELKLEDCDDDKDLPALSWVMKELRHPFFPKEGVEAAAILNGKPVRIRVLRSSSPQAD